MFFKLSHFRWAFVSHYSFLLLYLLGKSLYYVYVQNSMRATVELYENNSEGLPPVKAMVTLGKEDLSIKVKHMPILQKH